MSPEKPELARSGSLSEHQRANFGEGGLVARKNWRTLEPYHGFIYFSKDAAAEYAALGLRPESGYFASRSAPMGAVTAPVVTATFFNFNATLVESAMDGVWDVASPAEVHAARLRAVDTGLRHALDDAIATHDIGEAAALARTASEGCSASGRPLYAGHDSLGWPDEPHVQLWLAITLVREYRGDGHIAALTAEGLGALEALHLHAASGEVAAAILQQTRGWPDDEWNECADAMRGRGLLDGNRLTEQGAALRQRIEDTTDRLAMEPWRHLGPEGSDRLRELVRPLSRAIVGGGTFGFAARPGEQGASQPRESSSGSPER